MNIYEVSIIEKEIDRIASENEGEIPEELLQKLVEAQTKSIESIENLCKYTQHLTHIQDTAKAEVDRINRIKQVAANKEASIKKYLLPYLLENGKVEAGLFKLSVRKSKKTIIGSGFIADERYGEFETNFKPDRSAIKKAIESGEEVIGAEVIEVDNVQVKL